MVDAARRVAPSSGGLTPVPGKRRTVGSGGDEMSRLLIDLRLRFPTESGRPLSQTASAARTAGRLNQSKVARAELGRFPLSPDDIDAYARALDAPVQVRDRLVTLAKAHESTNIVGRRQLIASAHVIQRRIADLLESTTTLRAWVPDLVPGILQTEDYTRAVVGREPGPNWWRPRLDQKRILTDLGRDVHIIIGETALRTGLGSAEAMAAQLDDLASWTERPPVRLGVVPLDHVLPKPPPRGLYVYGEHSASQATEVGTTFINDGPTVRELAKLHAELANYALYGAEARAVIAAAARRWLDCPA